MKCFQFITDHTFAHSGRSTGKDQIADIYRKVSGNIGYNTIEVLQHKAGLALSAPVLYFYKDRN